MGRMVEQMIAITTRMSKTVHWEDRSGALRSYLHHSHKSATTYESTNLVAQSEMLHVVDLLVT